MYMACGLNSPCHYSEHLFMALIFSIISCYRRHNGSGSLKYKTLKQARCKLGDISCNEVQLAADDSCGLLLFLASKFGFEIQQRT